MDEISRRWGFSSDKSKKSSVEKDVETEESDTSLERKEQSSISKTLKLKLQEAWVQCEKPDCLKWRSISKTGAKALGDEPWFCYMNKDLRYNSCDVPEEDTQEAEEMVERCRLIYVRSILPAGSLVWAKMPGYSWWPGLVVVDVDYGVSVSVDSDGDPLSYHVEFLGPKRSRAWIPEHLVELYGDHVPFDPSAGRQEKATGLERTSFRGVSVKEAIKEAASFQALSLTQRLSRSYFLPSSPVAASSKPHRKDREKKKVRNSGLKSTKDKAADGETKRPDVEIDSQRDAKMMRKKKRKTEPAPGSKLLKKDASKVKRHCDGEPESKTRKLIPDEKSEECWKSSGDHPSSEQKSKSEASAAPMPMIEHNSSAANSDPDGSDFHGSRIVPDVDDVQKPTTDGSVEKTVAKQKSKVGAGKPSFMVPSSGSSRPSENKATAGSKKGFCPPVKTKALNDNSSSADAVKHVKPKAAASRTAFAVDQTVENVVGGNGQSYSEEVNETMLGRGEAASDFDDLGDEICSLAQQENEVEEGQGLQQLLAPSVSLVGRTKEEKYTIDVQIYKENHDRFEEDVRKFMSKNKQRMLKSPVWENRTVGLFELFLAIHDRGGYDMVCKKRMWTEIYNELTGISAAKPNPKTKNYYRRYLLPYELYINGRDYGHLFTKTEAGGEPTKAKKSSKSSGNEDKANVKHSKKSKAKEQKKEDANLQSEDGVDAENDEDAELEKLMLDLKEYDSLCQSQVSACLQHDVNGDNPTTPNRKLTSTPAKLEARTSFLSDMEEDDLLNDDAHIVPLACTLSPVFSSDREEESCELQEMEALKHELISMQQHLDEMNSSLL